MESIIAKATQMRGEEMEKNVPGCFLERETWRQLMALKEKTSR